MKKTIVVISIIISITIVSFSHSHGWQDVSDIQLRLEEKFKGYRLADKAYKGDLEINAQLEKDIYAFLKENEDVAYKDVRTYRLVSTLSHIMRFYLKMEEAKGRKLNDEDKYILGISEKLKEKDKLKPYYACKGNDKVKAEESRKKVELIDKALRDQAKEWKRQKKVKRYVDSDEYMAMQEQLYDECKFYQYVADRLIGIYASRAGERNKPNQYNRKALELFFRMIEDDQVNYDYLHTDTGSLNEGLRDIYIRIIGVIPAPSDDKNYLNKNEVRLFAESVLTKHALLFDFEADEIYQNDTYRYKGMRTLYFIYKWVERYEFDDLKVRMDEKYGAYIDLMIKREEIQGGV